MTWKVYFRELDDDTKPVLCGPDDDTRERALLRACPMRSRYVTLYIEGPGGTRIERDAILKWCASQGL